MNSLITIQNDNGKQTVNARELHEFLEVGNKFADWIAQRVFDYGFTQGVDYECFSQAGEKGGRPKKEYLFTLNMGKEMAMLESNEKGKQARRYFIEAEKALRELPTANLPQNYLEALKALVSTEEKNVYLKAENDSISKTLEIIKPAAEYGKAVMGADTLYTATNIGSEIGISAVALNNILRNRLNVIRRGTGETDYELCSRYANNGFVRYKTTTYQNSEGINKSTRSLRWTRKGFDWLTSQKCFIIDSDRKSLPVDMPVFGN